MTAASEQKMILVTGASGFIAKHICLKLLQAGHRVVGSVRSDSRAHETYETLKGHLDDANHLDQRLRFVKLTLANDEGWDQAMQGVDILMHTASPLPLEQPEDASELVDAAVGGTRRALTAASRAGVKRVVMTSSTAAIMGATLPQGRTEYDETIWSDPGGPNMMPYAKSKTLAERAAWDLVQNQARDMALTVINPAFVLGPPLDDHLSASIKVIQRLLRAKDPVLPDLCFSCVDVRDIAEMHIRALSQPESIGQRIVGAQRPICLVDMAKILAEAHPDRRIVTRRAPNWLMRMVGLFNKSVRSITPRLGQRDKLSNLKAQELLGMEFVDVADSLRQTAAVLLKRGLTK